MERVISIQKSKITLSDQKFIKNVDEKAIKVVFIINRILLLERNKILEIR